MATQGSKTQKLSWNERNKDNIFWTSLITAVGTLLSGLVLYYFPSWVTKKIKDSYLVGYVYESRNDSIFPVPGAKILLLDNDKYFLKNKFEEGTVSTGRFSGHITGVGRDSLTIEIINRDNQTFNYKIELNFEKDTNNLTPIILPTKSINKVVKRSDIPLPQLRESDKQNLNEQPRRIDSRQNDIQHDSISPVEFTNEKASIAVMAIRNEEFDIPLSYDFANWVQSASNLKDICHEKLIDEAKIEKIIEGKSELTKSYPSLKSTKFVCLIRCNSDYKGSEINESLTVATMSCEIVLVETATGKVIESFKHSEKASGISQEMARSRAESDFFNFLKTKTLKF